MVKNDPGTWELQAHVIREQRKRIAEKDEVIELRGIKIAEQENEIELLRNRVAALQKMLDEKTQIKRT